MPRKKAIKKVDDTKAIAEAVKELKKASKLTPEIVAEAARLASEGVPLSLVRQKWSIPMPTWQSWIQRGRQEILDWRSGAGELGLQSALVHALESGEVGAYEKLANTSGRTALLERRFRRHFEDKEIDQDTGEVSNPKEAALAALEKMFGGPK